MLTLREASCLYGEKEYLFLKEVPMDENGFTNQWNQVSREVFFSEALPQMISYSKGLNLPPSYVPETTYFLWKNDIIIGIFRIRHFLNKALEEGSGHIGYFIAPPYRGKQYGTKGLALTLEIARRIVPEKEIYLRVKLDNPASLRVMLHNGGMLHHKDETHYFVRIAK